MSTAGATPAQRLVSPPAVGAVVLIIGSLLPWGRDGGAGSSFDIPLKFLVDDKPSGSGGLKLGLLLLALGVAGAVLTTRRGLRRVRIGVGAAAVVAVVLFVVQLQRALSGSNVSLTDVLGPGVFIALIGAVALAAAPARWPGPPPAA